MKENYKRILILVIIIIFFIGCLTNIKTVINEFLNYTILFIKNVFPTSFLFILISSLLTEYQLIYYFQKATRIKSLQVYYLLMTLISGFPTGIVLIKDGLEKNVISIKEANHLVMFCHFPNPLFILYTVSNSLDGIKNTIILYVIYIISNIIICLMFSEDSHELIVGYHDNSSFSSILASCINKTFKVISLIYGTSIFFYSFSIFFRSLTINNVYLYVLINGIFDLTNGISSSILIDSLFLRGLFILFFISIGSFAIDIQIKSILEDTSISYKKFLLGRLLSVFICSNIWIIYSCFV